MIFKFEKGTLIFIAGLVSAGWVETPAAHPS